MERQTGRLRVRHLHVITSKIVEFVKALSPALKAFIQFNGASSLALEDITSEDKLSARLLAQIKLSLAAL